jgi:hypothetical protein
MEGGQRQARRQSGHLLMPLKHIADQWNRAAGLGV